MFTRPNMLDWAVLVFLVLTWPRPDMAAILSCLALITFGWWCGAGAGAGTGHTNILAHPYRYYVPQYHRVFSFSTHVLPDSISGSANTITVTLNTGDVQTITEHQLCRRYSSKIYEELLSRHTTRIDGMPPCIWSYVSNGTVEDGTPGKLQCAREWGCPVLVSEWSPIERDIALITWQEWQLQQLEILQWQSLGQERHTPHPVFGGLDEDSKYLQHRPEDGWFTCSTFHIKYEAPKLVQEWLTRSHTNLSFPSPPECTAPLTRPSIDQCIEQGDIYQLQRNELKGWCKLILPPTERNQSTLAIGGSSLFVSPSTFLWMKRDIQIYYFQDPRDPHTILDAWKQQLSNNRIAFTTLRPNQYLLSGNHWNLHFHFVSEPLKLFLCRQPLDIDSILYRPSLRNFIMTYRGLIAKLTHSLMILPSSKLQYYDFLFRQGFGLRIPGWSTHRTSRSLLKPGEEETGDLLSIVHQYRQTQMPNVYQNVLEHELRQFSFVNSRQEHFYSRFYSL